MRWLGAVTIAVALVLIGFALVHVLRPRFSPGPLELRIVDRAGRAPRELYQLTLDDDQRLLVWTSARLTLTPGEHRITLTPWEPSSSKSKSSALTLRVIEDATSPNRPLELPVGDGLLKRFFSRTRPPPAPVPTPMHLRVSLPGGAPAAGAWYTCEDDVWNLDADGEGECPGTSPWKSIHVGTGALGGSFPFSVGPTALELAPAVNFKPRVSTPDARPVRPRGIHLTINSTNQVIDRWYSSTKVLLPGLAQERAIACLKLDELSACDVIPADGGTYEPEMRLSSDAQVIFTAMSNGAPMTKVIVYVDRVRTDLRGPPSTMMVSPGRHVLVLNSALSEARHERIFEITSGQVLDLGELALE